MHVEIVSGECDLQTYSIALIMAGLVTLNHPHYVNKHHFSHVLVQALMWEPVWAHDKDNSLATMNAYLACCYIIIMCTIANNDLVFRLQKSS